MAFLAPPWLRLWIRGGAATPPNKHLQTKKHHVFHGDADCYDV